MEIFFSKNEQLLNLELILKEMYILERMQLLDQMHIFAVIPQSEKTPKSVLLLN